jgi:hypothetical protein
MKTAIIVIFFVVSSVLSAQEKGESNPEFNPDSVFIFNSPRSLIDPDEDKASLKNAFGADLIFSESGFGGGVFYQRSFGGDYFGFLSLYISGSRNTDEFDYYDPYTGTYRVPDKVNRLYIFPVTIGIQKNFFSEEIADSFRPYLSAGFGPTFILSTPYDKEFFSAFGSASGYTRLGGFLGIGANFGSNNKTLLSANIRYYIIPFGGKGLESIKDLPITQFGGIFLSVSVGTRFN